MRWWGRSHNISTFPCSHGKDFLMGHIRKIQEKQEGKNGENKKKRF
jgi:hypothetical protein